MQHISSMLAVMCAHVSMIFGTMGLNGQERTLHLNIASTDIEQSSRAEHIVYGSTSGDARVWDTYHAISLVRTNG